MFLYFVVIATFHDHVKYGCNENSHLLGIFTDEQKAKAVVAKYVTPNGQDIHDGLLYKVYFDSKLQNDYGFNDMKYAFEGGHYDIYYRGFVPGMSCGGGTYVE